MVRTLGPVCCLPRCLLSRRTLHHAHNRPQFQSSPVLDMDQHPIETNPQCPTTLFVWAVCLNVALLGPLVAQPPGGECRAHGRRSWPLRRTARRPLSFLGSLPPFAGPPPLFPSSFWAPRRGQMGCKTPTRRPLMPVVMGMLKKPPIYCRELCAEMCKRGRAGPGRPERGD